MTTAVPAIRPGKPGRTTALEPPIGASREGAMRGFFRFVVTIVLSTAVLAGIIALKTEIYLPHFNQ